MRKNEVNKNAVRLQQPLDSTFPSKPLLDLIDDQKQSLIKALYDAVKPLNHIGELFKSTHTPNRLFLDNNPFDTLIKNCYFIRMSVNPIEADEQLKKIINRKSAVILHGNKAFYYDHYMKIHSLTIKGDFREVVALFPTESELNQLKLAGEIELDKLKGLCHQFPPDLIDELCHYFTAYPPSYEPKAFYNQIEQLMTSFFSPIEKSKEWKDFWTVQKKSLKSEADEVHYLIKGAFLFKMKALTSYRLQRKGQLNNYLIKQHTDAIEEICLCPNFSTFENRCRDLLRSAIRTELQNKVVLLQDHTIYETISNSIYYKLCPDAYKIYEEQLKNTRAVLKAELKKVEEIKSKEARKPGRFSKPKDNGSKTQSNSQRSGDLIESDFDPFFPPHIHFTKSLEESSPRKQITQGKRPGLLSSSESQSIEQQTVATQPIKIRKRISVPKITVDNFDLLRSSPNPHDLDFSLNSPKKAPPKYNQAESLYLLPCILISPDSSTGNSLFPNFT